MMGPKFLFLMALFVSCSIASAENASLQSPEKILLRIQNEGGKKVLWSLWENQEQFGAMLDLAAAADPRWIEVFRQLRPYSDAGASEMIDMSVARALPLTPETILNLIGSGFELEFICTSPFIEPEPGIAERYEEKTLEALAHIKDPKLKILAQKCAESIKLPSQ